MTLTLKKGGTLDLRKWDGEDRGNYRIKKTQDEFCLIDKETGNTVHCAPTREEIEEVFWKPEEVKYIWTHLRDSLDLEEGTTVDDLIQVINSHVELRGLCDVLFPNWEQFNHNGAYVFRVAVIANDVLHISNECEATDDGLLHICPKMQLRSEDEVLFEGDYSFSFLELLDALFGEERHSWEAPIDILSIPVGLDSLGYLLSPVYVEEGTTAQDIFDLVAGNEDLKTFISMYSWCSEIDNFHKEAKSPPPDDQIEDPDEDEKLHFTTIRRYLEAHHPQPRFKLDAYFEETIDFGGLGDVSKATLEHHQRHGTEPPEYDHYGIGFNRAYKYAHLPLVVKEDYEIRLMPQYSRKGRAKTGLEILAKVRTPFTLLDILDAIYWEISFYGGPEKRDLLLEDITGRIEECRLDTGEKFESVDKMLKKLENDEN